MEQLMKLQRAVYDAAWGVIRIETQSLGWRREDADAAQASYEAAKKAYLDVFGITHEWEDRYMPGLHGAMPLEKPTQQRIIELCGGIE